MEEFKKLGLSESILKAIKEQRFEKPSEIQEKTIPLVIEGKDVIACSSTGSGKTLAFGSGSLQHCQKNKGIQTLVLTPTRELAEQIQKNLILFSKYRPFNISVIYGGVSINPQITNLRRADLVVGTPGRILDHLERRTINLKNVNCLVLDEADRMLDMGFIEDVEKIISQCPKKRQTLLFSATLPPEIAKLSRKHMHNPVKINAEANVDPRKLKQVYYNVKDNLKFSFLVHLLKNEESGLVMVFCNTRRSTDFVAKNLKINKIRAVAIHGGLTQSKRSRIMENFHKGKVYVLVCTDVAARGLDIKGVSHVYNFDIPKDSKEYIHRIGRTARAGKEGIAINILGSRDHENFDRVLRDNDIKIDLLETPYIEKVKIDASEGKRRSNFGRDSGKRFGPRRGPGRGESRNESHSRRSRGESDSRSRSDRNKGSSGFGNKRPGFSGRSNHRNREGGGKRFGPRRGPGRG